VQFLLQAIILKSGRGFSPPAAVILSDGK